MINKGIILAGGLGTRMSPLTKAVNKQLLPVYDKPLLFYPLSILMLAGIKDILIIVNQGQLSQFKKILPDSKNLGINITFAQQKHPRGLPDAFIIGENVKGGLYSEYPSLNPSDWLYGEDLQHTIDFRGIYGTILQQWMGIDPHDIIGGDFEQISPFKKTLII